MIWRDSSSLPRPKPSTPALFEITVRSLTRESRSASISASGNAAQAEAADGHQLAVATMPASAAAALGKILFIADPSGRVAEIISVGAAQNRRREKQTMMDAAGLQATLEELGAEYTKRLGLRVETAAPGEVTLTPPVTARAGAWRRRPLRPGDPGGGGYGNAAGDDRSTGRIQPMTTGAAAGEFLAARWPGDDGCRRHRACSALRQDPFVRGGRVQDCGWQACRARDHDVRAVLARIAASIAESASEPA